MKTTIRCVLCLLAGISSAAFADGSGTLFQDGKQIALTSAYAFRGPDPFEKTQQITTIVFADKPIDAASADTANDRAEAIDDQLRRSGATRVDLNLESDGSVQNVDAQAPGSSSSQSGSGCKESTSSHIE
jgi:hypothetical protein